MAFLDDYRDFVAQQETRESDSRFSQRLALTEPWYLFETSTGNIRINTARMVLARHARGWRRSKVAGLLGISLKEVRMMERRRFPLFLPVERVACILHAFEYPLSFFATFETPEQKNDRNCVKRQVADWRRMEAPKFVCFSE